MTLLEVLKKFLNFTQTYLYKICYLWRFTFEQIHNTKEQIYFYERGENHKAKEWMFKSFK